MDILMQVKQRGSNDSTMVDGHSWSTLDGPLGIRFFPQWDPAYMAELQKYIRDFKKIKNCFWWSWNADSGKLLQGHL